MATCKDCVHVGVCRFKDLPAPLSDSYIRESECIEKRCGDFKDRSRFVGLPIFDDYEEVNEMTIEAAIIELNRLKVNGYMPVDVDRRDRAIEKVKAALSKQIPKKSNPEREYCYGNGQCPNCNAVFLDKLTNFCGNCGQALDWNPA